MGLREKEELHTILHKMIEESVGSSSFILRSIWFGSQFWGSPTK